MFFARWRCIVSACLAAGLAASPAIGQTQQQIDACDYSDSTPTAQLDAMVDACTSLIQSNALSQQSLVWALNSRGNVYKRKAFVGIDALDEKFAEKYKHGPNYSRALADYTEAIRLEPEGFAPYYNRAGLYGLAGEHDLAIADDSKVIEIGTSVDLKAITYSKRASEWDAKGQSGRALADYTEAIRLKPDASQHYYSRSYLYRKLGNEAQAEADRKHAEDLHAQGK